MEDYIFMKHPSNSTQKVQMVVTRDEKVKKRTVITVVNQSITVFSFLRLPIAIHQQQITQNPTIIAPR